MTMTRDGDAGEGSELTPTAEAIINAIERPKKSTLEERGPGGWLPKLDLPGFGDERDDCGEEIPHFCECCGGTFEVGRTCAQSVCRRCAPAWVLKRAGTSREGGEDVAGHVAKIDALARMMSQERGGASIKTHHIVFSPPMDSWFLEAADPLKRTQKVIREILQAFDAEGFVYYHPWAGDNEEHDGDDRGEWKSRLFSDREFEGDVRDELIPRGHFHAIVCSEWIEGGETVAQVNEATDWVIKRIAKRDGSGRSLDGLEDVARATTYCLSHTGIRTDGERNRAAYTWFGSTLKRINYCPAKDEADAAVRAVAPDTLGIPARSVQCFEEVAPGEASHDHDPTPPDVNVEGDETASSETTPEEVELVPCNGAVRPIDAAPEYLENPEWRASARHAGELQTTWEEWNSGDGWPGS